MGSRFDATYLSASPCYPNAIAWSEENLLAVGSGHVVTVLVLDISDKLYGYYLSVNFEEILNGSTGHFHVLKHESSQRFWIIGKIVRISEGKAFVHFAEAIEEQHDGWFSLKIGPDKGKEAGSSFNMRPTLDLGRLPNEIYLVEHSKEVMEALVKGQLVEAWVDNRWIEGAFLGTNDAQLLIDLHGDYGCIILRPENVRLMPMWIPDENSWQITVVKLRKMTTSLHDVPDIKCATGTGRNVNQDKRKESSRKRHEDTAFPTSLSAEEYVFRSNLLSSLVVSWSPMLRLSTNLGAVTISGFSKTCALLAVGGKCGKISFWRFNEPKSYTVDQCPVSVDAMLVGILQAHTSWVTAISWVVLESAPKFLLATGSYDGCVKLWLGDIEGVVTPNEVNDDCVCLLREVIVAAGPVSVLSCVAPSKSPNEILLAVGKGSGLLEVLRCDISSGEIKFNRQFNAHDQVVSYPSLALLGLLMVIACTAAVRYILFAGSIFVLVQCLYCYHSVDNSVHCWILQADTLCLVHFPLNSPSLAYDSKRTSSEVLLVLVHSVDTALVDPMYESRAQRAAVELIWTGGMISVSLDNLPDEYVDAVPGFSDKDLVCWQSSILWTLEQYACSAKPLILWDIMEALLAFNQVSPNYVETILYNWFLSWWPDPDSLVSLESMLSSAPNLLHIIDSRHMHLINIICRRLVLPEMKSVAYNSKHELQSVDVEVVKLWSNLLLHSEAELRRRLVALTFSAVLYLASGTASALPLDRPCWFPTGVAQMQQWVVMNNNLVPDDLKLLKLEVDKIQKRLFSVCEYVPEEWCSFCPSLVPFESPEVAYCGGTGCNYVGGEKHKLLRCAASMQVCDASPSWFCMCCQRYVYKLAPSTLFMVHSSQYSGHMTESTFLQTYSIPCCPFCGILLQRLQPEFLLSTCLV
ncbi:hypothetical protein EJ110_NYTH44613 [Nymphaea thermarum]|nr:hypothetical protein EJ110_NYTH44613 [Nymphaea thermarum]